MAKTQNTQAGDVSIRNDNQPMTNVPYHRRHRRRFIWLMLLVPFLFVAIPTAFAATPTMPWYPVQRMGESLTINLAPVEKDFFRAMFAARRVRDA